MPNGECIDRRCPGCFCWNNVAGDQRILRRRLTPVGSLQTTSLASRKDLFAAYGYVKGIEIARPISCQVSGVRRERVNGSVRRDSRRAESADQR